MRKFLKIVGIIFACLVGLLVAAGIYSSFQPKLGGVTTTLTYHGKTVIIHSSNISTEKLDGATQYTFSKHVVLAKDKKFSLDGKALDFSAGNTVETLAL